jgi:hypothetical protein
MFDIEPSITGWIIGAMALYTGLIGIRAVRRFHRWNDQRRQWQSWHQFQQARVDAARLNARKATDSAS